MLRYFTIMLVLITALDSYGQAFSVAPNPVAVEADLNTSGNVFEVVAEALITNYTNSTLRLKWERIVNDKPACWETSVLGVWVQSFYTVDSLDFDLSAGDEGLFNVSAFIDFDGVGATGGEAEVVLEVTNRDDPQDTVQVTYLFSVTGDNICLTNTTEITAEPSVIYPNPVQQSFRLRGVPSVDYIRIYNTGGERLREYTVTPDQHYDLGDLPDGLYLLQLFDQHHSLLQTTKLIKS